MIIAFFGPDGSGKTTLATMLATHLLNRGAKVSYVRFKSHHLIMYLLILLLQKFELIPRTNSPRVLDYMLRRYFHKSIVFFYLELLNAIVWLFVNIRIRRLIKKEIIIAERYVPDFAVSMLLLTCNINVLNYVLRILNKFINNTIKIFLYANPNDILNRKKSEELSYDYIIMLLNLYKYIVTYIGADLIINTSQHNVLQAFRIIKRHVDLTLKTRNTKNSESWAIGCIDS